MTLRRSFLASFAPSLCTVLGLLMLAGCMDEKALMERFMPKADDALARRFMEAMRAGDYDAVKNLLEVAQRTEKNLAVLPQLHDLMAGEMKDLHPIGVHIMKGSGSAASYTDLNYEMELAKGWLQVQFRIIDDGGVRRVRVFNLYKLPHSLESVNAFSLAGKSMGQYVFLLLVIAVPLFILGTLVVCIRTPLRRRKVLWCILVLIGGGQFRMDWTTGAMDHQLMYLSLLGAGAFHVGAAAPWILSLSAPVGAILFLLRRRSLMREGETPGALVPPPLPSAPDPPPVDVPSTAASPSPSVTE